MVDVSFHLLGLLKMETRILHFSFLKRNKSFKRLIPEQQRTVNPKNSKLKSFFGRFTN